jgi:UDP-2-acetamido-3-amino-2,3-dideoxy-glucuronate N-acetyltransferase
MSATEMRDDPRFPGVKIHESAYVDDGVSIGAGSKVWHFVHVLGETVIGRDCVLGQNVMVGPRVTMGDGCKVQNNVALYDGVVLEKTLVRTGASIGANATIVCGHTLGAYCFIAAGAVVAKDVPDFALMAGVPARRIGWMSHNGARLGPDLVCPETGRRYRETGPDTLEEIR